MAKNIFVTGGTGYMGTRLISALLTRGHDVEALVRPGSERKLPNGCRPLLGNPLAGSTYAGFLQPDHTFVQLVGVAHPGPAKAAAFKTIDRVAGLEAVRAAAQARIEQFVYVSVARAPSVMKAYVAVRKEVEGALEQSGLKGTVLRPWYVLGPGHRWPLALIPAYWILKKIPSMRAIAEQLDLVTIDQMIRALVFSVETPAVGLRVLDVPAIKSIMPL